MNKALLPKCRCYGSSGKIHAHLSNKARVCVALSFLCVYLSIFLSVAFLHVMTNSTVVLKVISVPILGLLW